MNYKEKMIKINQALQFIRQSNKSGSHLNCIRLSPICSDVHNAEIINRCVECLKKGIPFMTETEFIHGGRADLLLPSTWEIIEILHSETDERFLQKIKKYPDIFKIRRVRV